MVRLLVGMVEESEFIGDFGVEHFFQGFFQIFIHRGQTHFMERGCVFDENDQVVFFQEELLHVALNQFFELVVGDGFRQGFDLMFHILCLGCNHYSKALGLSSTFLGNSQFRLTFYTESS